MSLDLLLSMARKQYNEQLEFFLGTVPEGSRVCCHEMDLNYNADAKSMTYQFNIHALEDEQKCEAGVRRVEYTRKDV